MSSRKRLSLILLALATLAASFAGTAWAIRPDEVLANPRQEQRARAIGRELRCLVCQNESIDDSDADLAHDLRVLVRQRLVAGDSDDQVKNYIVARYGNYVLLKPPFLAETYLLWLGPALLLMAAAGAAVFFYRHGATQHNSPSLSPEEQRRIAALIDSGMSGTKDS